MILDKFRPAIDVFVSPDVFRFSRREKREDIQTFLLMHENRIMGIGDAFEGSDICQRVDLFNGSQTSTSEPKAWYLQAFMRYGIRKVIDRRIMLRPKIIFHNTDSLTQSCSGYQNLILRSAALESGAYSCEIEGEHAPPVQPRSGAH